MSARLRVAWLGGCVATLLLPTPSSSLAADGSKSRHNGAIEVAGRQVQCANVVTRFDRHLPNLGAASPEARLMILNPALLRRYSKPVQLFVFHHECGHLHVGQSELAADCWAIGEGVRDGWLDRVGLGQVCRSFENAPETDTHPSAQRRCANLDRCFAKAEAEQMQAVATKAPTLSVSTAKPAITPPKLIATPRLVRSSTTR